MYLLGHDEAELRRLEHQAAMLAPATELILRMAGLEPGMRVLDLGTGTGDVARIAASLVGPTGSVTAIDSAPEALETARALSPGTIEYVEGDVASWHDGREFDAVIGRLILLYTRDAAAVLRHHAASLRPGGLMVAMEFDMTGARSVPPTAAVADAQRWITGAFGRAGLDAGLGARLSEIFTAAGMPGYAQLGLQAYHGPDSHDGPQILAGVLRTMLPLFTEPVDPEAVADQMRAELAAARAVFVPPTLVGCWGAV